MHQWFVWNVLFRLQEFAKGHETFAILGEMEAADRLEPDAYEELCAGKLRDLIRYAHRHVPYVQSRLEQLGLDPLQIQGPEDLPLLPVMTKADVRQNRQSLHSDVARNMAPFSTGGSTGEPLLFDLAKRRVAARVACRQRVSRWWGVSVGVPEIALWGAPAELKRQDRIRQWRDRLLATELLSAFEMTEPVMTSYLDRMEQSGCRQIFGYPSSIYLLCLHARKLNRDLRRLKIKAAFVTGEVLLAAQRKLISETLDCPVADGYGGRDSGFIAHECPQGGMHVLRDAAITEIVDPAGQPLPPGQVGEIVVTDLYSHEMPFIRYATGDLGALSAEACSCGRPLPLLEKIEGRMTDFVVAPDGRILHALSVIYILREIEGVAQYKIIQESLTTFRVQIVRNAEYRQQESEAKIHQGFDSRLRCPVNLGIEYVQDFPAEASGKFRHVVSKVSPEQAASNAPTLSIAGGQGF